MKNYSLIFGLLASVAPLCVAAEDLLLFPEGSVRGFESFNSSATLHLPVGPFVEGAVATAQADGDIRRQVWKTPNINAETSDLINGLRDQLKTAGYQVLFECETRDCGGFDFRFQADVVDEPDMHVDLGDFRYLSATKLSAGKEEFVGLLVSRSPEQGFIQVTTIGSEPIVNAKAVLSTKQSSVAEELLLIENLETRLSSKGVVVLEGLEFGKGSSDLNSGSSDELRDLAKLLSSNPDQKVVLVGHTDASGSLKGNIALSRKRADSVMSRLVESYGVNPEQVSAEGVGFLSPRASNSNEEGRERNRRVEVVLTTLE